MSSAGGGKRAPRAPRRGRAGPGRAPRSPQAPEGRRWAAGPPPQQGRARGKGGGGRRRPGPGVSSGGRAAGEGGGSPTKPGPAEAAAAAAGGVGAAKPPPAALLSSSSSLLLLLLLASPLSGASVGGCPAAAWCWASSPLSASPPCRGGAGRGARRGSCRLIPSPFRFNGGRGDESRRPPLSPPAAALSLAAAPSRGARPAMAAGGREGAVARRGRQEPARRCRARRLPRWEAAI